MLVPPGSGQGFTGFEAFLHLDVIDVQKGQQVTAGETALGRSGGQTSGGAHHVTNPRYSTGPHTEVQLVTDKGNINPTAIVKAGPTGGGGSSVADSSAPFGLNLNPFAGASDYLSSQGHNLS